MNDPQWLDILIAAGHHGSSIKFQDIEMIHPQEVAIENDYCYRGKQIGFMQHTRKALKA